MVAVIVLSAIVVALIALLAWFYRYSGTQAWIDSEVRTSMLRVLVILGPMLGMHYKPPRPTLPAVTTPGPEPEPLPGKGHDDAAAQPPTAPGSR